MHGGDYRWRQWFGDIANTAADKPLGRCGICVTKPFYAPANLWKKITRFEL